jgi:hypothetical protein
VLLDISRSRYRQIPGVIHGKPNYHYQYENLRKSFKSELLILKYDNRLWTHTQSNNEA